MFTLSPSITRAGVFSLSNRSDDDRAVRGIENLRRELNLETVVGRYNSVLRRFAGDDNERASVFNSLAADPSIDILIAMRGGYGVTRVLDRLDFDVLRESGKILCGYSDVTALLLAAWKNGCGDLYHGPMAAAGFDLDPASDAFKQEISAFVDLVNGKKELLTDWCSFRTVKSGKAEGPLIPVNLTLLTALCGTDYMPDLNGSILVVEDVGEPSHDVDRNLNHLRQCGIIDSLSGIIFGKFSNCEDDEYLPEIIGEYASMVKGPSLCDLAFGHIHPSLPLPFGKRCSFEVSENKAALTLL